MKPKQITEGKGIKENLQSYFLGSLPTHPEDKRLYCENCGSYNAGTGYCRVCKHYQLKSL